MATETCPSFARLLRISAKKHDLVAVQLSDPAEADLPRVGRVQLYDPETGKSLRINTSKAAVRRRYAEQRARWQLSLDRDFRDAGVDRIELSTDPTASPAPALHAFFARRSQHRG